MAQDQMKSEEEALYKALEAYLQTLPHLQKDVWLKFSCYVRIGNSSVEVSGANMKTLTEVVKEMK
jgi:hypothetical protein